MTRSELHAILDRIGAGGMLTPEAVVEAASDEGHPLHDQFEWDDAKAAHSHRVETARVLIRSVTYRSHVIHGRTVSVPAYVHSPVAAAGEQGYVALNSVQRASQEAAIVLRDELSRITGAAKRALAIASRVGSAGLEPRLSHLLAEAEEITAAVAAPPAVAAG